MKESYSEGLATHAGPESCGCRREVVLEALTGVHAGSVLSPESGYSGRPTLSKLWEGNMSWFVIVRARMLLRGHRPEACMDTPQTRTERSSGRPAVGWTASGSRKRSR
jgi:hypothetical protein